MSRPAPALKPQRRLARWWNRHASRARRSAFCAIATESFLPWALVLFDALERHHPQAARVLLYVRGEGEARRAPRLPGAEVITVEDLVDAAQEQALRRRYRIAELCFALKPRLLRHCLDRHGERAYYVDTDLDVHAPLESAAVALEGASIVLTPHLDAPLPRDGKRPSEVTILRAGSFNAGFVGVAESGEARAFLSWWDERAGTWGFVAPEAGYQGDQKWLDLAPALFPGVALLRDPGSNVGSWNLHSRHLERDARGGYLVNGSPLAFFHFSGFDPDAPASLSKYQNRFRLDDEPALAELAAGFARRVVDARGRARSIEWDARAGAPDGSAGGSPIAVPMAEADYRAAYEAATPEGSFETGEEIVLDVRVSNASARPWQVAPSSLGRGIALSWHLLDAAGNLLLWENRRYPLPEDVAPGASVVLTLGIRAPDYPGRYQVELDLVHEDVAWFSVHGSERLRVPILVGLFEDSR